MYKGARVLCVIPARKGSKGVPGKNRRLVAGAPLISYAIRGAQQSEWIDRILLSTDDEAVAQIGRNMGLEVPFLRPETLAEDDTPVSFVALHGLDWLRDERGETYDVVLLMLPTTLFVIGYDLDRSIEAFWDLQPDSLVTVRETRDHPYWVNDIEGDLLRPFINEGLPLNKLRRQDVGKAYVFNGAVYMTRSESLREHRNFFFGNLGYHVMPDYRSLDVDSEMDILVAEAVFSKGEFNRRLKLEHGEAFFSRYHLDFAYQGGERDAD